MLNIFILISAVIITCSAAATKTSKTTTTKANPCLVNGGPCLNGATCIRRGLSGYKCLCQANYKGSTCSIEITTMKKTKTTATTTRYPCPLFKCAFPQNCESWIIGNFTMNDGTVCPGCPICTQFQQIKTTKLKMRCIPPPCAFPFGCIKTEMEYYTLSDGTVCPGCPICIERATDQIY